jgi:hypothetical protein
VTATDLEPHLAGRQVEIVVNDQDRGRLEAVEARQRRDRLAAEVHEGPGLEQPDPLTGQGGIGEFAAETALSTNQKPTLWRVSA